MLKRLSALLAVTLALICAPMELPAQAAGSADARVQVILAGDSHMNDAGVSDGVYAFIGSPANVAVNGYGVDGRTMEVFLNWYEGTDATKLSSRCKPATQTCILVFGAGTNDIYNARSVAEITGYYTAIAAYYKALGWVVYEVTIPPLDPGNFRTTWVTNTVTNTGGLEPTWSTARSNHLLNLHRAVSNPTGGSDDFEADEIHLNSTGQTKFARLIAAALAMDGYASLYGYQYLLLDKALLADNQTDHNTINALVNTLAGYPSGGTTTYSIERIGSGGSNCYMKLLPRVLTQWSENTTFRNGVSTMFASPAAWFAKIVDAVGT